MKKKNNKRNIVAADVISNYRCRHRMREFDRIPDKFTTNVIFLSRIVNKILSTWCSDEWINYQFNNWASNNIIIIL